VFAASRVYIPESIWPEVRDRTVAIMKDIKMGDVTDFRNFMGAVIDKRAFTKIGEYLDHGRKNATVVSGGVARGEDGYFIEPTLIETKDPGYRLLCEEIFGPSSQRTSTPQQVGRDAQDRGRDFALCPHRRDIQPRPFGNPRSGTRAP